jgi:threonine/homoserine/homoserine lactone efflux protein
VQADAIIVKPSEMTPLALASFFVIMLALAAMPSASVALVVARSSSLGLRNGIATALGIVAGDLIFVSISILGMSALAITLGSVFSVLKYVGGAYLIWLGVKLLKSKETNGITSVDNSRSSLCSSFLSGFLLTLGDFKAIFFYASLLPTLMNLSDLSPRDIAIVVAVTVLTVGGVKILYAIAARMIVSYLQHRTATIHTKKIAGGLMIGAGSYIIVKS